MPERDSAGGWAQAGWAWLAAFTFMHIAFPVKTRTNAHSRYAALCALAEDGSFRIDAYKGWSPDWLLMPDGRFLSNKAPGPVLLAAPFYLAYDRAITRGLRDAPRSARDEARARDIDDRLRWLPWLLQVIPFGCLTAAALRWLRAQGASAAARELAAGLMLFGSTAALFMNTFAGHALAAAWVLGGLLAALHGRHFWAAFALGWAALCDYGALLLLPGAALACRRLGAGRGALRDAALGAAVPAAIWIGWHLHHYGAVGLPYGHSNPQFFGYPAGPMTFYGMFRILPDLGVLWELLAGGSRGLLWSQGWVLLALGLLAGKPRDPRGPLPALAVFLGLGLALLLWMNAGFSGWHAGKTPGPRYLSSLLPCFGLLVGLLYDGLSRSWRAALWAELLACLILFVLVSASQRLSPPGYGLWAFYLQAVSAAPARAAAFAALLAGCGLAARRSASARS